MNQNTGNQKKYRVKFRLKGTSAPMQETVIQGSSVNVVKQIFAGMYPTGVLSSQPSEIREFR